MSNSITLCDAADVSEATGKVARYSDEPGSEIILIRRGDNIYGYRNICPHAGRSLSWGPDQLLFTPAGHLVCTAHGATFEVDTGLCQAGPCMGAYLSAVAITINDGKVQMQPGDDNNREQEIDNTSTR